MNKKFKKVLSLIAAAAMTMQMGLAMPVHAEGAITYGAETAVQPYPGSKMALTDRTLTMLDGTTQDVKALGYIAGGIGGASASDATGGPATYEAEIPEAGDYDVTLTFIGANNRRADIQVGETVYDFGTDVAEEYAAGWTVVTAADSAKIGFAHTYEDVAFAAGKNTIVVGTKDGSWAPDLVSLSIEKAEADAPVPGITYADGKITVVTAEETAGVLITASYDAKTGALTGVDAVDVTAGPAGVSVDSADPAQSPYNTKVMFWDSLAGQKPILPAVEFEGRPVVTEPPVEPTDAPTEKPTEQPTEPPVKPTVDPEKVYFALDFNKENIGQKADKDALGALKTTMTLSDGTQWVSQYDAADMSINSDSTDGIGNYYNFGNTTGKGTRTSYYTLPEAAKKLENNKAVLEFDLRMAASNAGDHIVITDNGAKNPPIGNGNYDSSYIFDLYQVDKDTFGVNTTNGADAAATSEGYTAGEWVHVKAFMDFDLHAVKLTVTSLDGVEYLNEVVPMNASTAASIDKIFICTQRNIGANVGIDNIVVSKAEGSIGVYYIATFDVEGKETNITVKEGECVAADDIPDVTKTGHIFDGWKLDDTETVMSTEEVLAAKATANVKYTATYHRDPEYIEPMVAVEFDQFPANGYPVAGADENTPADNPISLKLIGEIGGDLTADPDPRVTDLDVKWEFLGFRHIASKAADGEPAATTDDVNGNEYCDSYAEVVYDPASKTDVNFKLKSQAFNFYGEVRATVTYNGNTITITKPMAILPTKSADASVMLPKPGYVTNFDWYSDDMVGYNATISADNKSAVDVVTGDWAAYGGNSGRGLYLAKDEGGKFLKLKSTGTNSSTFAVNKLDAPKGQVIISQDVRFYNNGTAILYKQDNPVTWKDASTTFSLNFNGSSLSLNDGEAFGQVTAGVWYRIVLSADVTSKLAFAKVYDMEGKLLGESDVMPFSQAGSIAPIYLCYRTPDNAMGEFDFNNVKMYVPEIDGSKFTTTVADETLSIPEAGAADATTSLSATALSTEGYDMIGAATWALADDTVDPEKVIITPDASNSHNATLTVKNGAPSGELGINVTIGGVTKTITVNLTSSQDSVKFTKSTTSISIPLEAGASNTYEYAAQVVDGKGNAIAGKTVTYAVYDKNNKEQLTTLPEGVTFDAAAGKLTVSSEASATVLYVRATGTNTDNEPIMKAVKVTIHGLAFDFGSADDGAVAEGYTAVTPTTLYSDAAGYGIENGAPTVGGTASLEDANSDNLTGNFTFKAKVTPAKVYKVTVNYFGTAVSEKVEGSQDLTGVVRSNAAQSTVEYLVPVIDDVLDLTFSGGNVASIVIDKTEDKAANLKPHIYTVGDSTIANNGSWAYVLNRDFANYTDLANIASFSNNGRGGKNLSSYYTGGELIDRVLVNICPGDYVMIGDMGTNGMGADFEAAFNYYVDACEALGAKIILNSYSPHGAVGSYASGYDASTHTFNSYRQDAYDNIVRKIYEERTTVGGEKYDEKMIGFVDIGKMADAAFNAYVAAASDKDAAAQEIISCFGDHNHYSNGTLAAQLMIEGYEGAEGADGIVKALVKIISADQAK